MECLQSEITTSEVQSPNSILIRAHSGERGAWERPGVCVTVIESLSTGQFKYFTHRLRTSRTYVLDLGALLLSPHLRDARPCTCRTYSVYSVCSGVSLREVTRSACRNQSIFICWKKTCNVSSHLMAHSEVVGFNLWHRGRQNFHYVQEEEDSLRITASAEPTTWRNWWGSWESCCRRNCSEKIHMAEEKGVGDELYFSPRRKKLSLKVRDLLHFTMNK